MPTHTQVIIIGGGVSGLCAATLLEQELEVTDLVVLEAGSCAGGTARTTRTNGFTCEWGPNGWLDREPRTRAWVERLGLGDEIVPANEAAAHRFILKRGRLHEVKPPPGFLLSPLLSPVGRMRLLCEPLIGPKADDEPETIYDFACRRIGREAADMLVAPMVNGVYAGDAKQLSLAHCFPRMADMEREHGSLFRAMRALKKGGKAAMGPGGTLHSLRRGMGSVPEAAAERLGGRLHLDTAVTAVQREGGDYLVETVSGGQYRAPVVLVAAPAYAAAHFLPPLGRDLASALGAISYADVAVVCAGYARDRVAHDLNGFGFLVPRREGLRTLGCLWSSSLFPGRAPDGHVLLRIMLGGALDGDVVNLSDGGLIDLVGREVHPLLGIDGAPDFIHIARWQPGIPQYHLGHGLRLRAIAHAEEEHPGLIFAGNAYRGVGLNDCVASAHRAVRMAAGKLGAEAPA